MVSNDKRNGPGSETFILLNGLSVTEDEVLGDYEAWVTNGEEGTEWLLTALSGGELMWSREGVVTDESDDAGTTRYTATVTEYTESDCTIEAYGKERRCSNTVTMALVPVIRGFPLRACTRIKFDRRPDVKVRQFENCSAPTRTRRQHDRQIAPREINLPGR